MKDPTEVTNALQEKYGYKLKGVRSITYHLGSNYKCDPNDQMWAFKDIVAHEGPLTSNSPSYKGSTLTTLPFV